MEFLTSGPWHALAATFLLCVILWVAYLTGQVLLAVFGLGPSVFARLEERLFSTGAGMLVISAGVFFLGLAGKLSLIPITMLLMALPIVSFAVLKRRGEREWATGEVWRYISENRIFSLIVLSVFALSWIQAVTPPIGNDALAYHLHHAKEFVNRHRIGYLLFERESLWPYFTETFFMIGLLLEGTILPQLFHWSFYVMTAALVYSFGRRFFNERTARLAALIFIFTPAAFAQAGHAYVDLALAFFVFAGVYAFLLFELYEDDRLFILSGLMTGGAAAVKYLGLGAFFILTAMAAVCTKFRVRPLVYFLSAVFAASSFWYFHSWAAIGNPVYPFFSDLFGGSGYKFNIAENVGMGNSFFDFLKLPWNMTMHPMNFGGEMIGGAFLMFAPPLLLELKRVRRPMACAAVFAAVYTAFLFTQSQHLRFYISVAPFLSVAAAVSASRLSGAGKWAGRLAFGALALVLLLHGAIFVYRTRVYAPAAFGKITADDYLKKYERSYAGYLYLKEHLKGQERFFNSAEVRCFYNPAGERMQYDSMPFRLDLEKRGISIDRYLGSEAFDYIWILEDNSPDVKSWVEKHPYQLVYSYEITEKPRTFRYKIYKFDPSRASSDRVSD